MPAPAWLAAVGQAGQASLPVIGNIASLLLQRSWAKKDLAAQNLYNSPVEQLKRLKEAGLPAAAFFSGGVSSQSDQPRAVNVSPDLGTSEVFNKFQLNQIQKLQVQDMEQAVRLKKIQGDMAEAERDFMLTEWFDNMKNPVGTPLFRTLKAKLHENEARAKVEEIMVDIRGIEKSVRGQYDAEAQAVKIRQMLLQNETIKMLLDTQRDKQIFMRSVSQAFQKNGINGVEAVIFNLLYGEGASSMLNLFK